MGFSLDGICLILSHRIAIIFPRASSVVTYHHSIWQGNLCCAKSFRVWSVTGARVGSGVVVTCCSTGGSDDNVSKNIALTM